MILTEEEILKCLHYSKKNIGYDRFAQALFRNKVYKTIGDLAETALYFRKKNKEAFEALENGFTDNAKKILKNATRST